MEKIVNDIVNYYLGNRTDIISDNASNNDICEFLLKNDIMDVVNNEKQIYSKEDKNCILITGATGFLGNHFLKRLIENNPNERIVILTRRPELPFIHDNIEYINSSLLDVFSQGEKFKRIKQIFHFAAYVKHDDTADVWKESRTANLYATIMMYFLAFLNDAKFVYMSTSGVIALHSSDDDEDIVSMMPYYKTKTQAEWLISILSEFYSIPCVILRPSMMLGPKVNLFNLNSIYERNIIDKIQKHNILFNASGVANFIDVRYVADFCLLMYRSNFPYRINCYNLMGPNMVMSDFFRRVCEVNGWRKYYVPEFLAGLMTIFGIVKTTEYMMTTIGWYYESSDKDEFLNVCKKELEMMKIDYYEKYPIDDTLKHYS